MLNDKGLLLRNYTQVQNLCSHFPMIWSWYCCVKVNLTITGKSFFCHERQSFCRTSLWWTWLLSLQVTIQSHRLYQLKKEVSTNFDICRQPLCDSHGQLKMKINWRRETSNHYLKQTNWPYYSFLVVIFGIESFVRCPIVVDDRSMPAHMYLTPQDVHQRVLTPRCSDIQVFVLPNQTKTSVNKLWLSYSSKSVDFISFDPRFVNSPLNWLNNN